MSEEAEEILDDIVKKIDGILDHFKWVFDLFLDFIENPGMEIDLEELRGMYNLYWVL